MDPFRTKTHSMPHWIMNADCEFEGFTVASGWEQESVMNESYSILNQTGAHAWCVHVHVHMSNTYLCTCERII